MLKFIGIEKKHIQNDMANLEEKNSIERSREYLANERTFLAWIRTSIALMGFGFVIVKFSLFLKQLSLLLETRGITSKGYSSIVGVVMVAIGVIIAILAFLQYKNNEKQLKNNYFVSSSMLSLLITLIIIIGGIFLIVYLLSNIWFFFIRKPIFRRKWNNKVLTLTAMLGVMAGSEELWIFERLNKLVAGLKSCTFNPPLRKVSNR